ncbi:hypothetical protein GCM10025868_02740 [Angustibacter aerolatus]|uniref:Uncharacterized protein n=1 Tax=Angustibacter aerolatus TaxID=1162965 RepID=A0ABQ6JCU7_9ACTN|nr:hypothetical protein GCM10025868_02740 [Angustibacter aerolatus]
MRLGDGRVRAQGDAADVLGWLTGRTDGVGLRSADPLPDLPSLGLGSTRARLHR